MKAVNIKWDVDLEYGETYKEALEECGLPTEVDLPEDLEEEDISDWLSDVYGFCHGGFEVT